MAGRLRSGSAEVNGFEQEAGAGNGAPSSTEERCRHNSAIAANAKERSSFRVNRQRKRRLEASHSSTDGVSIYSAKWFSHNRLEMRLEKKARKCALVVAVHVQIVMGHNKPDDG